MLCLPRFEAVSESLKSLKDFSQRGFSRFTLQPENREMKTQVDDLKIKKTKDSKIRIIKRKSTIKDSRITMRKRTSTTKDSRIRMLKRANRIKDSRIRIL